MAARTAEAGPGPSGVLERLWEGRAGLGGHLLGAVLSVPELGFRGAVALRDLAYSKGLLPSTPAEVPTICVGNITVGGTGKTPLVRWVVGRLLERDRRPAILHGGYAADEPALHRRWFPDLPVVVERDRLRGAEAAVAQGADVLVLDDGFQHRRLARDLDVVLVSAERWRPPARLLPRGPYREPPRSLTRAHVVVVTRRTSTPDRAAAVAREIEGKWNPNTAIAFLEPGAWLTAQGRPRGGAPGEAVAVAGIGRPGAFFRQLESLGVTLNRVLGYRDHHAYTAEDAATIEAAAGGLPVATTAKDAVKLVDVLGGVDLWVLDQKVRFEAGEEHLLERLEEAV